ncbi:MAG: hypothetical protein U1E65_07030 [Myxococcota bacterium]
MRSVTALDRVLRLAGTVPVELRAELVPILVLGAGGSEPLTPAVAALMQAFFARLGIDAATPLEEVEARIEAWWSADPRLASWVKALQELLDDQGDHTRNLRARLAMNSLGSRSELRPVGGRAAPPGALLGARAQLEIFMQRDKTK